MVPVEEDKETGKTHEAAHKDNPFMRGIMGFDDYNYNNINELVLIEEPARAERRKLV